MSTKPKKEPAQTWHKGPPPHVGWWNASVCQSQHAWRWWDGQAWSASSGSHRFAVEAAARKKQLSGGGRRRIEWSDYYPTDARVPRLNPAEGWLLNTGKRPKHADRVEVVFFDGRRHVSAAGRWLWDLPGTAALWRGAMAYAWRPAP